MKNGSLGLFRFCSQILHVPLATYHFLGHDTIFWSPWLALSSVTKGQISITKEHITLRM